MNREKHGNLSLFKVPIFFAASKNRSYRKHILMKAEAIAKVFTKNKLTYDDLCERFYKNQEEFTVIINDLTDEGIEFSGESFDKWLDNTDRWKAEHSVEKYIDSLTKQLEKFREAYDC